MDEIQPWLFVIALGAALRAIAPLEGESLSHFLGRFRRENDLSASGLGKEAGIGAVVARWDKVLSKSVSVAWGVGSIS